MNLKLIHERMKKNKPKLYKVYNLFIGISGSLNAEELKEFKVTSEKEYRKFVRLMDREIKRAAKSKAA